MLWFPSSTFDPRFHMLSRQDQQKAPSCIRKPGKVSKKADGTIKVESYHGLMNYFEIVPIHLDMQYSVTDFTALALSL